jgi:glycosyltransferase involved in cell wall biosynthesis
MIHELYSPQKTDGKETVLKIAILGPVFTGTYYGGVATFDENLAYAFSRLGHEAVLFSDQKDAPEVTSRGIFVRRGRECRKWRCDLALASLFSARHLPTIPAEKKIFFLHGFYNMAEHGMAKTFAAVAFEKYIGSKSDLVLANSEFTRFINQQAFNLSSDESVRLGVAYDFREALARTDQENIERKPGSLLYVGRLAEAKCADQILRAMCVLKKQGCAYHLTVVGDGPDRERLEQFSRQHGLDVIFAGRKKQEEIVRYYRKSRVFISMNPSEPFGITFCEALLAGCGIVCPKTGGQTEFLADYPDRVRMADGNNPEETAAAIRWLCGRDETPFPDRGAFSYEDTARAILRAAGGGRR